RSGGAPPAARRARDDGARVPGRPGQHGRLLLAQRLRVDPRVRSRRAAPDRGPDAPPAGRGGAAAHPGRDPVLHRPPQARRRARREPGLAARKMPEDLRVNGWLVLPGSELHERFSRSSGPGGQSVNTADSRVELSFDVERSAALPGWARDRITERLAGRVAGGAKMCSPPCHPVNRMLNGKYRLLCWVFWSGGVEMGNIQELSGPPGSAVDRVATGVTSVSVLAEAIDKIQALIAHMA